MKRFDENVPRTLGEILIKHGRSPLTDPRLCENLLKDYCGAFKEEIALLVVAVKERIASDLLVSQDGLERDLLRALLVKRLRKGHALNEGDARWAVEAWSVAIRALSRWEAKLSPDDVSSTNVINEPAPLDQQPRFGIIGRCPQAIRSVAVSPSGDSLVTGSDDGLIRLWEPHSGKMKVVAECAGPVAAVAFSPTGVLVGSASGTSSTSIQIVDLQSGEILLLGAGGKQSPTVLFSPGGKSLASASADSRCEIQVWNLQTGQVRMLKGAWRGPSSISFSPDGREIAASDSDLSKAAIRLWDVDTGTARVLGHSTRRITSVAFLPDAKRLASGSYDETIRLWNLRTGEAGILGENCSCVCRIAISSAGDRLAAFSVDGRIRVWDVDTGRSRTIGECHGVNALSFLADGRRLVTGSSDGTVRLWDTGR